MLLVTGAPSRLDWLPLNLDPPRWEYALALIMLDPEVATNLGKVAEADG